MAFASAYVRLVLGDVFDDAVSGFLEPLMAIHEAHLVMLTEQGIVPPEDAAGIAAALLDLDLDAVRRVEFDGTDEDLFFHLERRLAASCGADVAGRLHTARSRNDIDMTMYRMRLRGLVYGVLATTVELRHVLLTQARSHTAAVFPVHTHTQPAQPTTIAHYLLAVVEQLERDAARLLQAISTTDRCPLGACAITGTGFPINRSRTSELLGFQGPTGNTYGSIATVDYLIEGVGAALAVAVGCGRFVQDLLLWSTAEVGYLTLADGFVQTSSIMPQKRNPVALEHARAILSRACGQLQAVAQMVHNTPFGDIVDSEDDLQPLVERAFSDTGRGVALLAAALATATFDTARMSSQARGNWVTVTELADTLSRDHGLAFATAHRLVSGVVRASGNDPAAAFDTFRRHVADAGLDVPMTAAEFAQALDPDHFVRIRETPGGPGPGAVAAALTASAAALDSDRERVGVIAAAWREADEIRRGLVRELADRRQGTMM